MSDSDDKRDDRHDDLPGRDLGSKFATELTTGARVAAPGATDTITPGIGPLGRNLLPAIDSSGAGEFPFPVSDVLLVAAGAAGFAVGWLAARASERERRRI